MGYDIKYQVKKLALISEETTVTVWIAAVSAAMGAILHDCAG
jgi:hypothetical protein